MVLGPDGNYWFTEFAGNKVASITTAGKFAEYNVPSAEAEPSGITVWSRQQPVVYRSACRQNREAYDRGKVHAVQGSNGERRSFP